MRETTVPCYIFDIDGTCADHGHRLPLLDVQQNDGKKDWDAFHAGCKDDPPIGPVCYLAATLIEARVPVVFLTGRMERQRKVTAQWLREAMDFGFNATPALNQVGDGELPWLAMRGEDDMREDTIVKPEMLKIVSEALLKVSPYIRPVMAFEDRPRVCQVWRELGLVVAKIGDWTEEKQSPASEAWAPKSIEEIYPTSLLGF